MQDWLIAPALILAFFLPGAALTWVRVKLEERTEESLLQLLIEATFSSVAISSLVMVALLELEYFRPAPLLWTLVLISVFLWALGLRRKFRVGLTVDWAEIGVLLSVFILFFVLTFPPFNYAIGDTDPGMYVVGGHQIARTGHIHAEVPTIAATPPGLFWHPGGIIPTEDLPPFLRSTGGRIAGLYEGIWTGAMFVTDAQDGRVTPQFLHLWMLWIALFVSLLGGSYAVAGLPILAALGALGFYGAARQIFVSQRTSICILLLLLFNWTFVYFSRLPVSEMSAFFCFAGGLWAVVRFTRTRSIAHAVLAGSLFGLSLFSRVDFLYQAPAFGALFAYLFVTRQLHRRWLFFFGSLATVATWAVFHAFLYSWPYMLACLCHVGICEMMRAQYLSILFLSIGVAIGGLLLGRWLVDRRSQNVQYSAVRWTKPASLVLAAVFASFLIYDSLPGFPLVTVKGVVSDWASNERLSRFALAVGLPGLLFGMAGAYELLRRRGEDLAVLIAVLLLLDVWLIHAFVRPLWFIVPYGLRYYSADLAPLLAFFAGWLIGEIAARIGRARWRLVATLALGAAVLMPSAAVLFRLASYDGMHRTLENLGELAARVHPDGIVLFDESNVLKAFQSPLYTIFGVESHTVYGAAADPGSALHGAFVQWVQSSRRPVYLVGQHELEQYGGIPLRMIGRGVLTVTEVQQVGQYRHLQLHWFDWPGQYSLYELAGGGRAVTGGVPASHQE